MHVVIQILLLLLSYLTCGVLRELFDRDVACARSPIRSSKVLTLSSIYVSIKHSFIVVYCRLHQLGLLRIIAHTVPEPDDFEKHTRLKEEEARIRPQL
ncbi:hypothetical protein ES319_A13G117000v1 [Gossypium barbadense]|uniref:Secreted protein n=3 Tax=Gossypium TaxID=3633 RepID=A0A5J5SXY9_GOSBA|nr:hypothetical protein ES319_A13G117000v1 [Gossypium barbadense]KAB2048493.1 hypothetical protein ES319_A13G117000v1 [Gossypium barbadense]TYG86298.1 hypothetical protein ES288_A13G123600v1 [Gossypium darwinii]TYH91577.1 hypothetical protein ES332_A13G125100v1 [Gossypium tomentosum]